MKGFLKKDKFDSGKDTNRTVVTFIGKPEFVIQAAFNAIKKAAELIDMRTHKGEHPRMGATDVCPIIPIKDVSIEHVSFFKGSLLRHSVPVCSMFRPGFSV